jgi:hypothetical protein
MDVLQSIILQITIPMAIQGFVIMLAGLGMLVAAWVKTKGN